MKKQILIEQYTVEKFKTQYPRFNQILQDKLEGTNITLNELLYIIVQSDPTYIQSKNEVGKLQETILKLYCDQPKEKIVTEEFQNYVKEGFTKQYNYINSKGEKIDTLVNLTTVDKFETFILPFKNIDSDDQKQGIKEYTYFKEIDQLINNGEIVKAQETNDWLMYIPLTEKQSILLGRKTKWCISQETSKNYFNKNGYNNVSPFLIQISKNAKESVIIDGEEVKVTVKYQFHFVDNEIKIWNTSDDEVYINLIILNSSLMEQFKKSVNQLQNMFSSDKYKKLKLSVDTNIYIRYLLTKDNLLLEKINLYQVNKYQYQIQYINNPSEQVQLQQVNRNGDQIQFIKNPTEQVQLQQVNQYGNQIYYIKNPSEQVQLQQVKQNENQIQFIKNPTEQVQMQQVNENWSQLQYIKNPSEKIQLQQVNRNGNQIYYIENPSEQIQLQQVNQYGNQLEYIKNPSEQVQLQQVNRNGNQIQFIKNPSEQVQMQQVKQNENYIKYIKNPSEQIQLQQVNRNGNQIQFIKNPTEQVKQLYKQLTTTKEQKNLFKKLLDI